MRLWRGPRWRPLVLHAQGSDVRRLQERLAELGYDPGPTDGHFGYLTHEAVLAFQRDSGLRADGIIGPQARLAMAQHTAGAPVQAYVLSVGESLQNAARALGTSVEALRHMNRLPLRSRGYPGQRLVCRPHYLVGAIGSDSLAGCRSLRSAGSILSALAAPAAVVYQGVLQIALPSEAIRESAQRHSLDLWLGVMPAWRLGTQASPQACVDSLPRQDSALKKVVQELVAVSRDWGAGIWLDMGQARWGDGRRLHRLVSLFREMLQRHQLPLMLSIPLPAGSSARRWWLTDIDYARLGQMADRLVVAGHVSGPLESRVVGIRRLRALLPMLPAGRVLLGIGLGAEERDARGSLLRELTYNQALTTAYLAGVRPRWDREREMLRGAVVSRRDGDSQVEGSADSVLWLANRDAVGSRVEVVHQLRLAGALLWPLGGEDIRVWDTLSKMVKPVRSPSD